MYGRYTDVTLHRGIVRRCLEIIRVPLALFHFRAPPLLLAITYCFRMYLHHGCRHTEEKIQQRPSITPAHLLLFSTIFSLHPPPHTTTTSMTITTCFTTEARHVSAAPHLHVSARKTSLSSACSSSSCASSSSKRSECSTQKSHDVKGKAHEIGAVLQHGNRRLGLALLTSDIYVYVRINVQIVCMQL